MNSQNNHTLPDGWEMKRLGELITLISGQHINSEDYNEDGNGMGYLTGPSDFSSSGPIISKWTSKPKIISEQGDILITVKGSGVGSICQNNHQVAISRQLMAIRPIKAPGLFLINHLLKQHKNISEAATGSTVPGLSRKDIEAILISLPPLAEQRQIAAVLGTWDRAIEQTTELLRALRTRHRGLMQRLLTGKVRLPGFSEEWREYSYDQLLREVKRNVRFNDEELYRLISVRRRSGGLFHRQSLFGHQIMTKNLRLARSGDFLFSKMQILHGASGLTTDAFDGMMISGSYIAVVSRDEDVLDIAYFNWLSQSPYFYHQTFVSSYGVHIEKMTFDFDAFLGLVTKIPPTVEEQHAIARVLDASLREIRQREAKLDALREQKRGLMQCLLTGRVRVPGAAEVA